MSSNGFESITFELHAVLCKILQYDFDKNIEKSLRKSGDFSLRKIFFCGSAKPNSPAESVAPDQRIPTMPPPRSFSWRFPIHNTHTHRSISKNRHSLQDLWDSGTGLDARTCIYAWCMKIYLYISYTIVRRFGIRQRFDVVFCVWRALRCADGSRAPPRFSGPNCRVRLFNYRVCRGPSAMHPPRPSLPPFFFLSSLYHVDPFRFPSHTCLYTNPSTFMLYIAPWRAGHVYTYVYFSYIYIDLHLRMLCVKKYISFLPTAFICTAENPRLSTNLPLAEDAKIQCNFEITLQNLCTAKNYGFGSFQQTSDVHLIWFAIGVMNIACYDCINVKLENLNLFVTFWWIFSLGSSVYSNDYRFC